MNSRINYWIYFNYQVEDNFKPNIETHVNYKLNRKTYDCQNHKVDDDSPKNDNHDSSST